MLNVHSQPGGETPAVIVIGTGWSGSVTLIGGSLSTICGLSAPFGPLKMRVVPEFKYPGDETYAPVCPAPDC